jgi:DNA-binding CsgD family transcriptional regulator
MSEDLTHREKEAARFALDGLSNRQVAAQMRTTEGTVKQYLSRVYDKVGAGGRRDLPRLLAGESRK